MGTHLSKINIQCFNGQYCRGFQTDIFLVPRIADGALMARSNTLKTSLEMKMTTPSL